MQYAVYAISLAYLCLPASASPASDPFPNVLLMVMTSRVSFPS
jgi:hypothetical protein